MELGFPPATARSGIAPAVTGAPFWASTRLFPDDAAAFLLDSALADGKLGRWSFAGGSPLAALAGWRRETAGEGLDLELTVWREPDGSTPAAPRRASWAGDPLAALRDLRRAYAPDPASPGDGCPFAGGLVGWFGYGAAWAFERLPRRAGDAGERSAVPDLLFLVHDEVLRHEHATGATTVAVTGRGRDRAGAERDLAARLEAWRSRLAGPGAVNPVAGRAAGAGAAAGGDAAGAWPAGAPDLAGLETACDEAAYLAAVERCRAHIRGGDAFEICLTRQLSATLDADPWRLYAALRALNPAPFAAFLRLDGVPGAAGTAVAGASPERFLRCTAAGLLESRPIKGTRPRGATPAADDALRRGLAEAEKDNAENTMIVDLVRSDLGRVAAIGSVAVPELRIVETYATVHQLVSTVTARLKDGCDALDAVRACFPGGSMTGAPKLEAMAIIEDLEPEPRGPYAGALGWLGWDGALDLSIVIRTFVCAGGRVSFGTGGAVTADSEPAAEYRESLDKARALVAALCAAGLAPRKEPS